MRIWALDRIHVFLSFLFSSCLFSNSISGQLPDNTGDTFYDRKLCTCVLYKSYACDNLSRSALQTLHRASGRARALNHFAGGASHAWCAYYEERVDSDRSCLNEWHAMDSIESRRPPSPDSLRLK